jgi:hypothetical protein
MSTSAVLSTQPQTITLDLNELVRFDQPGDYDIAVRSSRVSKPSAQAPVTLASNTLKLHILPATEQWQKSKLDAVQDILNSSPMTPDMLSAERTSAIADLRYLGTAAAIQMMAAGLREGGENQGCFCRGRHGATRRLA